MNRRQALRIGAPPVVALGLLLGLQPRPAQSLSTLVPPAPAPGPSTASGAEPPRPRDVSLAWNVAAAHEQSSDPLSSLSETLGAGVCALDFNRDGWIDLFFVGGEGHTRDYGRRSWWRESQGNRLFVNKGGKQFEDVTAAMHLDVSMWGMACAVADLDNDRFPDLVVTGVGGNRLFQNHGGAAFEDVTTRAGIVADRWSTGAAVADFNGDGLLDIYVSNYVLFAKGAHTFERTSGFQTAADIAFDQTLYDPEPNRLYVNRGGFRFENVADKLGVADSLGRGLGARWLDLNDDRWPDLLVVNDHETPNQVYINDRGRGFTRAGQLHLAFEVAGSHDAAFADFDNDGRAELFMSRGRGRPPALLAFSRAEDRYVDTAWPRGLASQNLLAFSGWAAVPADLDNDGYLDLYVANGSVLPDMDARFVAQAQPNSLFMNDGRGGFRLQSGRSDGHRPYSSRGALAADLDNDGQLEIVVANNNDALEILSFPPTNNNWLVLDLATSVRDVDVYGGTVTLETDRVTMTRALGAPQHFLSQGDPRIHFGLGQSTRVKRLRIDWRDGSTSVFRDLAVNQFVALDRDAGQLVGKRFSSPSRAHFGPSLAQQSREALLCLVRILLGAPVKEQDIGDLRALYGAAPPEVRVSLLQALPEQFAPPHLALVAEALRDPAPSVRATAVELLRRAELERSVSWLIPLLDDPDAGVQCAVADTFRFFFDEEEAVTQRKGLAVPALTRLLASGTPQAKICAAGALGAAESTRAVLPLLALAQGSDSDEVKAAAVRALGLIRDGRAVAPLRALVTDGATQAKTAGAGLIALSRLHDREVDSLLDRALRQPGRPGWRYGVLDYVFAQPEGVVFDRARLRRHLEALVRESPPRSVAALAALRAIGASGDPRLETTVIGLLTSAEDDIKTEAFVALASLGSPTAGRAFEARLLAAPSPIVAAVMRRLEGSRALTAPLLAKLFERSTPALAVAAMRKLPHETASAALALLFKRRRTADEATMLFKACAESGLELRAPLAAYEEAGASLEMRSLYLQCLLQRPAGVPDEAGDSPLRLRARGIVGQLLGDSSLARDQRLSVLLAAARFDPVVTRTWLVKEIDNLPVEQLPQAFAAVQAQGAVRPVRDFLLKLLDNPSRPADLRLHAAELLAPTDRRRVLPALHAGL